MCDPFVYRPNSDTEVYHRLKRESGRRLGKLTQYNRNNQDYGIKAEKINYPSGDSFAIPGITQERTRRQI